tara:strand:- start:677 stop:1474 length:798 start_codon:yes stop_codon:yes gene_type:complete
VTEFSDYINLEMPFFFKATFEFSLLFLFLLCFIHSTNVYGLKRTVREFTAGFFLTACCESVGVLSGAYVYPGYHFYLFSIPIVNPASWISLVYIVMAITNRFFLKESYSTNFLLKRLYNGSLLVSIFVLALVDSSLALVIDLVMDPLATIYNWWIWVDPEDVRVVNGVVDNYNFDTLTHLTTPDNPIADYFSSFFYQGYRYPTRLFGIPLINFIAWFVFVFVFAFQFRWVESKLNWSEFKKTIVLWFLMLVDVPFLCYLLITPNF